MLLYSRKKVRYRRDGYCWKKRKDGKTTREDHMKLKVQGTECIYGCYVHSAILPTFHRRCYWLLQVNPDIVLVHYLNVPYPDDNKLAVITPSLALWADKKEWTKDELVSQLKPMFFSEDEPDLNNELEISTAETVEAIVGQLMEKQRVARQAALVKQLECGCPDSTCADGKSCSHPMRRIGSKEGQNPGQGSRTPEGSNQVSSTTGTGSMMLNNSSPRVYSRDSRTHQSSATNQNSSSSANPANGGSSCSSSSGNTPPLVLSLSQIQGGGGLLILNSSNSSGSGGGQNQQSHLVNPVSVANFVCNTSRSMQKESRNSGHLVLKQEVMDTNPSSCLHSSKQNSKSNQRETKMEINDNLRQSMFSDASMYPNTSVSASRSRYYYRSTPVHHQQQQQQQQEVVMSSAPSTPSKHMDTSGGRGGGQEGAAAAAAAAEEYHKHQQSNGFCGDTVVLLGTDSSGSIVSKSDGSSIINGGFFNETLDLSQEDIQRTLSANMPLCPELDHHGNSTQHRNGSSNSVEEHHGGATPKTTHHTTQQSHSNHHHHHQTTEINPMDFIDSCDVVVSPTHVVDDDVFVNLDAFDMLGEFPELEGLDTATGHAGLLDVNPSDSSRSSGKTDSHQHQSNNHSLEGSAKITDYSPEWAYPEGGVKVLVTGPWHSSGPYTVLFDTFPVPTTLVQSGVLRCYCPAHEAGLATLQVACDGYVISNSVIFEYKPPPREEQVAAPEPKVERSNDNLLKFTLLQRLEAMDERLQIKQEPTDGDVVEDTALFVHPNFEDRLVAFCRSLTPRPWRRDDHHHQNNQPFAHHRGMTLLHLAGALGYSRLVCAMLHWRAENSSLVLDTEVDALSRDEDGYTPLMWACARGHRDTAIVLYKWNRTALRMRNAIDQTAGECARANGYTLLADELDRLEKRGEKGSSVATVSPAGSVASLNSTKSHDGVFLRPGAVTRSEASKYKLLNLDLMDSMDSGKLLSSTPSPLLSDFSASTRGAGGQKLVKRPSIDSGIHMSCATEFVSTIRPKSSKVFGVTPRLSKNDRSMSLPLHASISKDDCDSFEIHKRMDFALCEISNGGRSGSPLIDVEAVSDDDEREITPNSTVGEQDARVLTLAEQIIAAMPDRIKNESEDMLLDGSPGPSDSFQGNDTLSDVFMDPLLDQSSSSFESTEFNFEFSDHNYRYCDVATPCSSLSPASSSCLQSPCSFTLDSPSPPPTTADFCEFFQASGSMFEKDFSNLTLSDREQRELYEAAKIIQKAYRSYKGRLSSVTQQERTTHDDQDKERAAAVVIQNYYRRYKQYAYCKQMTKAATVIQNGYRSYCEHKRFKKSQEAAVCIQSYYRNYKEQGTTGSNREGTPGSTAGGLKRTYSQRRQHQAARKIQQFMRQSKNKLQRERAERERQVGQSVDAHPRSQYQGASSSYISQNSRSNNTDSPEDSKKDNDKK
ncbi:unnamed protein product [Callosobruchus maculatus]|uniref:CG-1 domain-containing protein n=1 Tax=Callosobruchus maculatus TaxID=64391 RepID=A0A653D0U7_CALMS|nr:unnamed protein product [Callosobruchus maculatus]